MRYIDHDLLESTLTNEWKEKAQQAYEKVKTPPVDKTRAEIINGNSSVWRDIKEDLKQLSHKKCWYCESSAHRIMGDVDHYRPKNKVAKCPDHSGYWWLAFNWRNYRFSCERCNRLDTDHVTGGVGGKHTYFPLWDESKRVYNECDIDDLDAERPLLLDPATIDDPELLTFDLDGTARPVYNEQEYPEEYLRAIRSIELYHLNHTDLKKRRQFEVCYKVFKLVTKIDKYRPNGQNDRSNLERVIYKDAAKELKKMISGEAEYSSAARAALAMFRTPKRLWVDRLLIAP